MFQAMKPSSPEMTDEGRVEVPGHSIFTVIALRD
jgi:hypothetical protein